MEFIQACFAENTPALISSLKFAGFSHAQAQQFLPAAVSCFDDNADCRNTSRTIDDLVSDNPAQVLHTIDLDVLAKKLNITPGLARYGLDAIEPLLSQIMTRKKDRIVEVIISLAWEDNGRLSQSGKDFFHHPHTSTQQKENHHV